MILLWVERNYEDSCSGFVESEYLRNVRTNNRAVGVYIFMYCVEASVLETIVGVQWVVMRDQLRPPCHVLHFSVRGAANIASAVDNSVTVGKIEGSVFAKTEGPAFRLA